MKPTATLLPLLAMLLGVACREAPAIDLNTGGEAPLKENLINANRYMVRGEEQQIEGYLQRRGWQTSKLAGGTRVMIATQGSGAPLQYNEEVSIRYSIETLGGQTIYGQQEETVVAGKLKPTAGLDAALLTLRHGDEARVIVPSEQAYGVVGDADRIGSRMTLVYHLFVK